MGNVPPKTEEPKLTDQQIESFCKLLESQQKNILSSAKDERFTVYPRNETLNTKQISTSTTNKGKYKQSDSEDESFTVHPGNETLSTKKISTSTTSKGKHKQTDSEDTRILKQHLKNMLFSSSDHDVLFKVKNKEFKAHKNMLRARSPVFETMFKQKMKSSTEGEIKINDCDSDAFGQLLEYVYTGEVENMSPHDALGLYSASYKYDFPALKKRCVDLLKNSLSSKFICNVLMLAVNHADQELLRNVITFASEHLEEILETPEWQQFLINNPIQANELSLRALQKRRTSSIR